MPSLSYHSLGAFYDRFLYDFIRKSEAFEPRPYYDTDTPRNASVGTGFNVHNNPAVLRAVLNAMGVGLPIPVPAGTSQADQDAANAAEQGYRTEITALFNGPDLGSNDALRTQLDRIMENRAADPALLTGC